jgi:hypothetical protein
MPLKIALLKPGASQLLSQLVQVGLALATWPAPLAMVPGFKIIDFSGQANFASPSRGSTNCLEALGYFDQPFISMVVLGELVVVDEFDSQSFTVDE